MGRKELLENLQSKLCEKQTNKFNHRVALFGIGGVGKTQVAIEYVVTYKEKYNSVFWITAVDQPSLILGFQEIAIKTKLVNTEGMDGVSVAREVLRWLEKQNSWLLVMDNVDDISIVNNYLPDVTSGEGNILLTTRDPSTTGIPAQGLEVEVFESQTAVNLLLLRADLDDNSDVKINSEALKIVKELGFLALAIEQAAAYIRESLKDIFKFLAVYSANRDKLLAHRPRENWAYEFVVATTWSLSFDVIKKGNASAAELLNLFALLNPDEILLEFLDVGKMGLTESLNTLVGNSFELNKALGDLEQFSLIRCPGDGRIVLIHRLVQAVITDNLRNEDKRRFMEMVVALFLCAFPPFEEDKRQTCRRYQAQVIGPLRAIMELDTEDVAEVLLRVGSFLYAEGRYHDAEHVECRAVQIYILLFGQEDSRTLTSMNNLAETYGALGRTKDAAALHEEVLEAWTKMLGEEHPDTLSSMNNLAETYGALGRTKDAAALHEEVLEAWTKMLGEEHPDTLSSMNNLASTYDDLGRTKDAAALHEKVLEGQMRTLGEEHPNTLSSMNNLAETYGALGRTKDAAALHEKVLEARTRMLGEEHPNTLSSMYNLAAVYWSSDQHSRAIELYERELDLCSKIHGAQHQETLASIENLTCCYHDVGRMKEAALLVSHLKQNGDDD